RGDDRNSGGERLLHDLERGAPANENYATGERQLPIKKSTANHLVDGIVPADVFPDNSRLAIRPKQTGRMNAASASKIALCLSQLRWQGKQHFGFNTDASD